MSLPTSIVDKSESRAAQYSTDKIQELSDPFTGISGLRNVVWPKIRGFLGRQKRRIFPPPSNTALQPVIGFTKGSAKTLTKRALLIYLLPGFYTDPAELERKGFVTALQSLEIARALNRLGYIVDAIDHTDDTFVPKAHYDVCFGMHYNYGRLLPLLAKNKVTTIYYATGAYWEVENAAEQARCKSLKARRGLDSQLPLRLKPNNWVQRSDAIIAQGNDYVLDPYRMHNSRVFGIDHAASFTGAPDFERKDFSLSARRNFLWFGSIGLLHKGLDVVLEAFSELKDLHLWVCGPLQSPDEREFVRAYRKELFHTPNIHPIGHINIRSDTFRQLTEKCVATVHASCADSVPGGVLDCMARALIPVVSVESGMDTAGFGITLEQSSVAEIRQAVTDITNTPPEVCRRMSEEAYQTATTRYTLSCFSDNIERILKEILDAN